ncbi:MAG: hypothetical protein K2K38_05345 [Clostridia bacterium]|nr:hypothetical protein [Clostridia bacterium]
MNRRVLKAAATLAATVILIVTVLFSGCGLFDAADTRKWVLNTVKANYYYYDQMDKEGLDDLTVEEIVSRLDIYSEFYTQEELQALIKDNSGEKAGIGFSYSYLKAGVSSVYPEGGCLLVTVVGNSPAEKSGMRVGQLLTGGSYNGNTVSFDSEDTLGEFVDPIASGVEFTLISSTGENFTVSKQEYNASYMFMATNSSAWTPALNGNGEVTGLTKVDDRKIEYLPEGTAYVSMSQFFGTAADEFGYIMKQFNADHCTSLILDLRNNGGGYVDVMQDMAGYFTSTMGSDTHLAMTAKYKSGREEIYNCKSHNGGLVSADTTVYVLANSGTASASEALMGVLISYDFLKYENIFLSDYNEEFLTWAGADYGTARSYGKGIMQTTFTNFFTGEALKLTTAQIYWPNGKCIHGVGLTKADGCKTVKTDWLVTPDDEELKSVVEIIKGN